MIKKIVEPTGDLCIKFTEEELNKLGIKEGDKFSYEEHDGGFLLRKYESIEIDFSDFSKETLQFLITYSVDNNLTIEEAIEKILTDYFKNNSLDAQQDSDTINQP
jgi:bifunctional DNA-binding transcriptional regulator/antitoxin component of YhaV-PrlF toxin-antitoxin module